MAKNWNLPSLMKEWTDDEAMDMYHELTAKPESASHRNGSANGRSTGTGGTDAEESCPADRHN